MKQPPKILLIGDLHAPKSFDAVDALIDETAPDQIILLGDYLDHFYDKPIDAARAGVWLQARLQDPRYTFLLGNHDLPYLFPSQISCPGYTMKKAAAFRQALDIDVFLSVAKLAHWLDDQTLISHGGLSRYWVPEGVSVESLPAWLEEQIARAWDDLRVSTGWPSHWIWRAGFARGGDQSIGGLLWCDFDEEFEPIPGLSQIFGHTPARKIRRHDAPDGTVNLCVDTCNPYGDGPAEVLLYENGTYTPVQVGEG